MSATFTITLDTQTSVGVSINGNNSTTQDVTVTVGLTVPGDVEKMKVWGSLDPTNPTNFDFGETEGDADWIDIDTEFQVVLNPAEGQKTIHVRVRDDVLNEATAFDRITLGTEAEVQPTPGRPAPGTRLPQPPEVPPVEVEHVRTVSHLRVTSSARARLRRPERRRGGAILGSTARVRARQRGVASVSHLRDTARVRGAVHGESGVVINTSARIRRRGDGDDVAAIVELLL